MKNRKGIQKMEVRMFEDQIPTYEHEDPRTIATPFDLYNSYLSSRLDKNKMLKDSPMGNISLMATQGTIFNEMVRFRMLTELKGYCDYVEMITGTENCPYIANALYNSLIENVYRTFEDIFRDRSALMDGLIGHEGGITGPVLSMASIAYTTTFETLYEAGIVVTDKIYNDITVANFIFSDHMESILIKILTDFDEVHRPVIEMGKENLDRFIRRRISISKSSNTLK